MSEHTIEIIKSLNETKVAICNMVAQLPSNNDTIGSAATLDRQLDTIDGQIHTLLNPPITALLNIPATIIEEK